MTGAQDSNNDYPITDKMLFASSLGSQGLRGNDFVSALDEGNQSEIPLDAAANLLCESTFVVQPWTAANLLCESSNSSTGFVTYNAGANLEATSGSSPTPREIYNAGAQLESLSATQLVGSEINRSDVNISSTSDTEILSSIILKTSANLNSTSNSTINANEIYYGVASLTCNPASLYAGTKFARGTSAITSVSALSGTSSVTLRASLTTINFGFSIGNGFNNTVDSIAIQSDEKILVAGNFTSYNGSTRNYIIRLNSDASIDSGFSIGTGFNNRVETIAIQSDGKILVGGAFTSYNGTSRNNIIRLNSDGSVDSGFSIGTGFVATAVEIIAVQSDGKILVGGDFLSYDGTARRRIIRLDSNGSIDSSFTIGTGFANPAIVYSIVTQSDGKILVGGYFTSYNGNSSNYIIRLNSDGSVDSGFSIGTGFNSIVHTLLVLSDGKILVGGNFTSYDGTTSRRIARLNSDGSIDSGFSTGTGFNNNVYSITILSDGRIFVGGAFTTYQGIIRNCIIRLNGDGSIDYSLSIGTGFNNAVYSLAVQSDKQILAGGLFTSYNGTTSKYISRLNPDSSLLASSGNTTHYGAASFSAISSVVFIANKINRGVINFASVSSSVAQVNTVRAGMGSLLVSSTISAIANKAAKGNSSLLNNATFNSAASEINRAIATLLTTANLTANVNSTNNAAASLICNPTVFYSGTEINRATSLIASISSLAAIASKTNRGITSFVATTNFTLNSNKINRGTSSIVSVVALEAEVNTIQKGVAALLSFSSATSLANKTARGISSLNIESNTVAAAVKIHSGVASLDSEVVLSAEVNTTQKGVASLLSFSSATSLANKTARGNASIAAISNSLFNASQTNFSSSNLNVIVYLSASNNSEIGGSALLLVAGTIASFGSRIVYANLVLTVSNSIIAVDNLNLFAVANFASQSNLIGDGNNPNIYSASSIEVVGSLTSFGIQTYESSSLMQSESSVGALGDAISSSSCNLTSISSCSVDAAVYLGGFAALICNSTLYGNSTLRKNFYPDGLVIETGGSAETSYSYIFLLETFWQTRKSVEFIREFNWNTGQSPLRWYRVQGCCKYPTAQGSGDPLVYPNLPDPALPGGCSVMGIETDDALCIGSLGKQQFVQNLLGRSVGDICDQLNASGLRWEICSIKQWSRPADATNNDDCNKLVEVPFKDIPECLDLAVRSLSVNIGVRTYVIESINFVIGSGGLTIGGSAITSSSVPSTQSFYEYSPTGLEVLTGGSALTSSSWDNELTTTIALSTSIVDLDFIYGESEAPDLILAPAPVNVICGNCRAMPQVLYVHHNLNVSNPLVQFLNRNGIKMPNPVTLHYSRRLQSWTANVHLYGEGDDNLGSDESWRFSFEWSCVSEVAGDDLTGPSWKFSVLIVRKNESTGFDLDSRVMLILPPEQICSGTSNLDFDFSFSFNTATKFVSTDSDVTANLVLLNDKIGLFKSKFWTLNPNLNIRLSRSNVSIFVARQDISNIFPSASVLNVATPFVTR